MTSKQRCLAADPAHAEVGHLLGDRLMELIVMQDYPKTRRDVFALGVHWFSVPPPPDRQK